MARGRRRNGTAPAEQPATPGPPLPPVAPFGISRAQLVALNERKDDGALREHGGVAGLAAALCSDPHRGLSTQGPPGEGAGEGLAPSLHERKEVFGVNEMATVPPKSLFRLMWENLQDPILLLLIAAALVSTVLGAAIPEQRHESGWVEGVAIWVAIAVVVLVSSFNDYSKDRQFAALNRRRDLTEVTVIRDGAETRVMNTQVVVGDLLVLSAGDKVAADGVLVGGDHGALQVDESSLTGESEAVHKGTGDDPWIRCGTQVQDGGGRVLALAVGGDTEYGKTLALVGGAGDQTTPLTEKLNDLAGAIGKVGGIAAVVLFVVLMIIWMVQNRGFPIKKINEDGPVQFFLYCVTLVVVAVPEGLPLAVTISLAYSMRQMMDDECFVRVLEACETMGGCTAICSDKTGTLTQNTMAVVEGWAAGRAFGRPPAPSELPPELLEDIQLNIALNSKAFLLDNRSENATLPGKGKAATGTATGKPPLAPGATVAEPSGPEGATQPGTRGDLSNGMITAAAPAAGANGARLGGGTGDVEQGRPGLARGSDGVIVQDVLPPHQQVGGEVRGWAWLQWTILRCVGLHKRPAEEYSSDTDSRVSSRVSSTRLSGRNASDSAQAGPRQHSDDQPRDGHHHQQHHRRHQHPPAAAAAAPAGVMLPRVTFVGNRTECALLVLMNYTWGVRQYDDVRREYEEAVEHVWAFSSERKMSSVLVRLPDGSPHGPGLRLYNKGAAEWVLGRCTAMYDADGYVVQLDEQRRRQLLDVVDDMAARGLRCICLAARDMPPHWGQGQGQGQGVGGQQDKEAPADDMVVQALLGIKDPVRPEVPEAVRTCQRAGITVRMVTGDNIKTARFIAAECGIYTPGQWPGDPAGGLAMEGPTFRALSDQELQEALPRLQVLARSSPTDKYRLVGALKAQRQVVAVTGDGTNDAPALKESDVGLAMGITGTEVAKEAADIVILDDNFSSIVQAVMWGRTVFENIRKFVTFQLTINIVALVVAFVGAIAGGREPLTVLQLLWVNLIMDTLAALALATERPDRRILHRRPYGRHEHLITPTMWRYMLSQSAYQIAVLFFLLYGLPSVMPGRYGTAVDPEHKRSLSLLFNSFIFMQVFNEINCRRISDELNVFAQLHRSPIFIAVLAVTVGCQVIIIELLGSFFTVQPLIWQEWLVSIGLGAVGLPLSTAVRLAGRALRRCGGQGDGGGRRGPHEHGHEHGHGHGREHGREHEHGQRQVEMQA